MNAKPTTQLPASPPLSSSDLFSIPMRPWNEIEPDVRRMSMDRHKGQDGWMLRALYGKGASGKGRHALINALVRRDVAAALEAWSRDISAGRRVMENNQAQTPPT